MYVRRHRYHTVVLLLSPSAASTSELSVLASLLQASLPVVGSLEALPRFEAVSRQYFHCLGLGLGLALTVLVLCLETKTVQDTC